MILPIYGGAHKHIIDFIYHLFSLVQLLLLIFLTFTFLFDFVYVRQE